MKFCGRIGTCSRYCRIRSFRSILSGYNARRAREQYVTAGFIDVQDHTGTEQVDYNRSRAYRLVVPVAETRFESRSRHNGTATQT